MKSFVFPTSDNLISIAWFFSSIHKTSKMFSLFFTTLLVKQKEKSKKSLEMCVINIHEMSVLPHGWWIELTFSQNALGTMLLCKFLQNSNSFLSGEDLDKNNVLGRKSQRLLLCTFQTYFDFRERMRAESSLLSQEDFCNRSITISWERKYEAEWNLRYPIIFSKSFSQCGNLSISLFRFYVKKFLVKCWL